MTRRGNRTTVFINKMVGTWVEQLARKNYFLNWISWLYFEFENLWNSMSRKHERPFRPQFEMNEMIKLKRRSLPSTLTHLSTAKREVSEIKGLWPSGSSPD